jgi:hypothetical protein
MAAAFFNAAAPPGWHALSGGLTPQAEVSTRLMPLLSGTEAAHFADLDKPRAFGSIEANRAITIDESVTGVERWRTSGTDEEIRDQIREHVRVLIGELQRNGP